MAEYLAYAGVEYEEKRAPSGFPFAYRVTDDTLRVSGPAQGVDEDAAVLKRNDVVRSFDGKKADTVFQFLERKSTSPPRLGPNQGPQEPPRGRSRSRCSSAGMKARLGSLEQPPAPAGRFPAP